MTAPIFRNFGPLVAHAPNGKGTKSAALWLGGKTRSPEAIAGLQTLGEKLPTSTMPIVA